MARDWLEGFYGWYMYLVEKQTKLSNENQTKARLTACVRWMHKPFLRTIIIIYLVIDYK